jgi:hypothetical protein
VLRGIAGGDWAMETVWVSHGLIALTAALLAIAPWLKQMRFSLRTLLIATTPVAVVPGLIVYAVSG